MKRNSNAFWSILMALLLIPALVTGKQYSGAG